MIPNFTFLGKTFSAYMFLTLAGVLVMLYFGWRAAQTQGLDELHMLNLLLFSMIGVLVGSHMLYGITNLPLLLALVQGLGSFDSWQAFWQARWEWTCVWRSGQDFCTTSARPSTTKSRAST